MFDASIIETELFNVRGWKNWHDLVEIPALTGTLNTSLFNSFYNESDALMNLNFIEATMPVGKDLSEHLTGLNNRCAKDIVRRIIRIKKEFHQTKDNLGTVNLFSGTGRQPIVKNDRFVGYKYTLKEGEGLQVVIPKMMLHFTEVQTDLDFYVFHESQVDPIQTFTVTTTKALSSESVTIPEIKLPYRTADYIGGDYYVGYYEEDIAGQAINFDFDVSKHCGCPGTNGSWFRQRSQFVNICSIAVSDFTKTEMHDPANENIALKQTFGINQTISVKCDITMFLTENKSQFDEPMYYLMRLMLADQYLNSGSINALQGITDQFVAFEREKAEKKLEGFEENGKVVTGILEGLHFDFSGYNSPCIPCHQKTGVKTRTIF